MSIYLRLYTISSLIIIVVLVLLIVLNASGLVEVPGLVREKLVSGVEGVSVSASINWDYSSAKYIPVILSISNNGDKPVVVEGIVNARARYDGSWRSVKASPAISLPVTIEPNKTLSFLVLVDIATSIPVAGGGGEIGVYFEVVVNGTSKCVELYRNNRVYQTIGVNKAFITILNATLLRVEDRSAGKASIYLQVTIKAKGSTLATIKEISVDTKYTHSVNYRIRPEEVISLTYLVNETSIDDPEWATDTEHLIMVTYEYAGITDQISSIAIVKG